MLRNVYDWMGKQVHSPYAVPILAALFFIEAIFFVPVDPLLILYCIQQPTRSFYFATIATISSVCGGMLSYLIGFAIWESVGQHLVGLFFSPETFNNAVQQFQTHEISAILIAGFTPVPYKLVTLAAGFCQLSFTPFVMCSIIARGSRFFLVATVLWIWGPQIKEYIDRYFNLFVLLFTIAIIGAVWLIF